MHYAIPHFTHSLDRHIGLSEANSRCCDRYWIGCLSTHRWWLIASSQLLFVRRGRPAVMFNCRKYVMCLLTYFLMSSLVQELRWRRSYVSAAITTSSLCVTFLCKWPVTVNEASPWKVVFHHPLTALAYALFVCRQYAPIGRCFINLYPSRCHGASFHASTDAVTLVVGSDGQIPNQIQVPNPEFLNLKS